MEMLSKIDQILKMSVLPILRKDGGDVRILGFEDGVLTLHVLGRCRSCPNVHVEVKELVESALDQNGFPNVSVELYIPIDPDLYELAQKILIKDIILE